MRYVLVGLGNIGQKRLAVLGARCVASVDPINPAADYTSLESCPSGRYDAAILAVPNQAKLNLLETLLRQGKHVLIEKPLLFVDDTSVERLARLAVEQGVIWYTSYNHRFEPLLARMKERLEAGAIGKLYHGRFFYGNGTVANTAHTWRDAGLGVIEDLGCHLLDLAGHLAGAAGQPFHLVAHHRGEADAPDHGLLLSADGRLSLEVSFVCWRNTFAAELYGDKGSLHCHGLVKWGPAELVERTRVLPSGMPAESRQIASGSDETWARDIEHFERLAVAGQTSADNDRWISSVMRSLAA